LTALSTFGTLTSKTFNLFIHGVDFSKKELSAIANRQTIAFELI
jgi:hypothetical protein